MLRIAVLRRKFATLSVGLTLGLLPGVLAPAAAQDTIYIGGSGQPSVEVDLSVLDGMGAGPARYSSAASALPRQRVTQSRQAKPKPQVTAKAKTKKPARTKVAAATPKKSKAAKRARPTQLASAPAATRDGSAGLPPINLPVLQAAPPAATPPPAPAPAPVAEPPKPNPPPLAAPTPAPPPAAAVKPAPAPVLSSGPSLVPPAAANTPPVAPIPAPPPSPAPQPAAVPAPPPQRPVPGAIAALPPPPPPQPAPQPAPQVAALPQRAPQVAPPPAPAFASPAPAAPAIPPPPTAVPAARPNETVAGLTPVPPPAETTLLRLEFDASGSSLSARGEQALTKLAGDLARSDDRLQIKAFAGGGSSGGSNARRLSLSRALAVRAYLLERGLGSTRIDVRALGQAADGGPADRVDIVLLGR